MWIISPERFKPCNYASGIGSYHVVPKRCAVASYHWYQGPSWFCPGFLWPGALRHVGVSVCQETVWEAFKIFWDQLPDRDQYQFWVNRCIDGSVSIKDIGSFFSQSEEHQSLIRSVSKPTLDLMQLLTWAHHGWTINDPTLLYFRELPWLLPWTGQ